MNTKKAFLFLVLVLLVAGSGVFLWYANKEFSKYYFSWEVGKEKFYQIKNTSDRNRKLVINEKEGFSFEIPTAWKIYDPEDNYNMAFYAQFISSNAQFDEKGVIKKGCFLKAGTSSILYDSVEELSEKMRQYFSDTLGLEIEKTTFKNVDGFEGVEYKAKNNQTGIFAISLAVLTKNGIYRFDSYFPQSDADVTECNNNFNEITSSISIELPRL